MVILDGLSKMYYKGWGGNLTALWPYSFNFNRVGKYICKFCNVCVLLLVCYNFVATCCSQKDQRPFESQGKLFLPPFHFLPKLKTTNAQGSLGPVLLKIVATLQTVLCIIVYPLNHVYNSCTFDKTLVAGDLPPNIFKNPSKI